MTEPLTCKGQIELELPPGFTAEVTIRFVPTPPEPLPAKSPATESEAA